MTGPTTKLDVAGTVKATAFQGDGSGLTGVSAVPAGSNTQIQFNNGGVAGASQYLSWVNTGRGKLGVGIASSAYSLHVDGQTLGGTTSAYTVGRFSVGNGDALDIGFMGTGGGAWLQSRNGTTSSTSYNMSLNPKGGNVGIGVTGPTSKLQVAGNITPDATASKDIGSSTLRWNNIYLTNAPNVSSDARLKKNVKDSDLGLGFINSLRAVSWTWKDENQGTTEHYGVIAQEAELAIAKAKGERSDVIVAHDKDSDSYSVRYTELIAPLIKAVQELYRDLLDVKSVNALQARQIASKADIETVEVLKAENAAKDLKIRELERKNEEMNKRLEKIEKALNAK